LQHVAEFEAALRALDADLMATIVEVDLEYCTPFICYRPSNPGKLPYLKLGLKSHAAMRKVAGTPTPTPRSSIPVRFTNVMSF
jgi:hypothetical protein